MKLGQAFDFMAQIARLLRGEAPPRRSTAAPPRTRHEIKRLPQLHSAPSDDSRAAAVMEA